MNFCPGRTDLQGRAGHRITVEYFSNFWEIDGLENAKYSTVIMKLKAHFARYGSPWFTSANFENFSCNLTLNTGHRAHTTARVMARLSRLSRQQKHCTAEKEQRGRPVLSNAELQKHSKSNHRNKPSTTFSQPKNTNTSPYHRKAPETQCQSRTGGRNIATEPEEAEEKL